MAQKPTHRQAALRANCAALPAVSLCCPGSTGVRLQHQSARRIQVVNVHGNAAMLPIAWPPAGTDYLRAALPFRRGPIAPRLRRGIGKVAAEPCARAIESLQVTSARFTWCPTAQCVRQSWRPSPGASGPFASSSRARSSPVAPKSPTCDASGPTYAPCVAPFACAAQR